MKSETTYPPEFIQIPRQVYQDRKVSKGSAILYGIIYLLSQSGKAFCFASNEVLCDMSKLSERQVSRSLSILEKRGYLISSYSDAEKRNREWLKTTIKYTKARLTGMSTAIDEDDGRDRHARLHKNNIYNKDIFSEPEAHEQVFDWKNYSSMMLDDKKRPFNPILVSYWFLKGLSFTSKKGVGLQYKRDCTAAKALLESGYSLDEVKGCMKYCRGKFDEMWTLETVASYMAAFIKVKGIK